MVYWRNLLGKFNIHWNNLRRSVQPYLNFDYDRWLEQIMIGGGIHQVASDEPWKRRCLTLYRLLGFYQFITALAKVVFSIKNGDDFVGLCASIVILTTITTTCAKVYILGHYVETVREAKMFVNSNCSSSGDPDYDATVRRDHGRMSGKVPMAIFLLLCFDQVVLMIPSSARDRLYGIPEQFHVLGATIAPLLQVAFVLMLAVFWGCRYFCISLTTMPILMGLKSELMVVARGYESIDQRGRALTFNAQINAAETSRKLPDNGLLLKHMKQLLETTVKQHVEVLRIIHLVQPLVSYIYAVKYYSVMFIVSLFAFLLIKSGVTFLFLGVLASAAVFTLECYSWCRMIDSIEETMEIIADSVTHLGFRLEHSMDSHSVYIEMRTSLMIIQLNAAQSEWFNCAGIFPITVESFGNLCMIIYKFATFLVDVDG